MIPWTIACQALLSMNSPGKNTRMGSHSLLQRIFPGIASWSPMPPVLAGGFFTTSATWKRIKESPSRTMRQEGSHLAVVTISTSISNTHPWPMEPQTGPGFVKCYPNALGHFIASSMVASPQEPGKSVHFAHSPICFLLLMFLGVFLLLFYFVIITVQFTKVRHISYFLIFVYSGITPNTTNSFFPCFSQKKNAKIDTKMACSTPEPTPNNPKIWDQSAANKSWTIMMEAKQILLLCLS